MSDDGQVSKIRTRRRAGTGTGPFGAQARNYWRSGWPCPLPLPPRSKEPPPSGFTGAKAFDDKGAPRLVTVKDLARWERDHADGNICLRLLRPYIGIDVDAYGNKVGAQALEAAEAALGPLPHTVRSTARDDGVSGIRLFRLPNGYAVTKEAERNLIKQFGLDVEIAGKSVRVSNIEIIRPEHRYMLVWPSINPHADGAEYRWLVEDDEGLSEVEGIAVPQQVGDLSMPWVEFLCTEAPMPRYGSTITKIPKATEVALRPGAEQAAPVRTVRPELPATPRQVVERQGDDDDFDDPGHGVREYSRADAERSLRTGLKEIREAPQSQINATLNRVAFWLFRFTPAFFDPSELGRRLLRAQREAWVRNGGADDGDYEAARKTIRSAREASRSSWTAVPPEEDLDVADPIEEEVEATGPDPTGADGETAAPAGSMAAEERASDRKKGIFFTDARFSEAIARVFEREGIVFSPELGWMTWNGTIWVRHGKQEGEPYVTDVAREWIIKRYRKAEAQLAELEELGEEAPKEERRVAEALVEAYRTMMSVSRLRGCVALARPQVSVPSELFDAHRDLLNTPDGIVDLTTGEVAEHDRELYMTKITRAGWKGLDFTSPGWEKVVEAVPDDSREWVQTFLGQGATGHLNTEGRLLLLDGGGENGKGALVNEGCVHALGDYAIVMSETLLMSGSSQHPTEKMALRGARFVVIDETPEARRLDTQRLKKILDQPVLPGARFLYMDEIRLELQMTLTVLTNYVPVVTEFDRGTWRRLARLRMPNTYYKPYEYEAMTDEDRAAPDVRVGDPSLKALLRDDEDTRAAVLAWLVRGAVKWYAAGRYQGAPSSRIERETKEWRLEGDLILRYAEDHLVFERGRHVIAAELFEHFAEWMSAQGHKPWAINTFTSRLKGHDLARDNRLTQARTSASSLDRPASRPPSRERYHDHSVPSRYVAWHGVAFAGSGTERGSAGAQSDEDGWDDPE